MSSVVTLYGLSELMDGHQSTFKPDWLDPKQNIGIEIEVESGEGVQFGSTGNNWTVKPDGSLRNGREYVLSRPLRGDALSEAIDEFFHHNQTRRSPTAGTHIHVDMRDKRSTVDVVKTMAAIIACIEPSIFDMFAEGRDCCGYTNPITTLPDQASYPLFSDKAGADEFASAFNPNTREYKYYGFNMLPLGRYGSVEFRYFNTAENREELVEWIQFCVSVKLAAVAIGSRAQLKPYLTSQEGWEEFLSSYFAPWKDQMLLSLPFKDVYFRYKKLRTRSSVNSPRPPVRCSAPTKENKLKNTRFKKFFAMKIPDRETGKMKLVYDLSELATAEGSRVFCQYDSAYQRPSSALFRDNDVLMHNSNIYLYDTSRAGWREWMYYDGNNVILERTPPETFNPFDVIAAFDHRLATISNPTIEGMVDLSIRPAYVEVMQAMRNALANYYQQDSVSTANQYEVTPVVSSI